MCNINLHKCIFNQLLRAEIKKADDLDYFNHKSSAFFILYNNTNKLYLHKVKKIYIITACCLFNKVLISRGIITFLDRMFSSMALNSCLIPMLAY